MVAYVFDKILSDGARAGQLPAREKSSREWFRNKASSTKVTQKDILSERSRLQNTLGIGQMYLFAYDPKYKKTLPYFDRYPLIFPFAKVGKRIMGINLHYLPHKQRAILMDALYELSSNKNYDEKTKLKLSYSVLNNASKFKWFKPTVHSYLPGQIRSRFVKIHSSEWDIALFLPLEKFEGASKSSVWKDSKASVK